MSLSQLVTLIFVLEVVKESAHSNKYSKEISKEIPQLKLSCAIFKNASKIAHALSVKNKSTKIKH